MKKENIKDGWKEVAKTVGSMNWSLEMTIRKELNKIYLITFLLGLSLTLLNITFFLHLIAD